MVKKISFRGLLKYLGKEVHVAEAIHANTPITERTSEMEMRGTLAIEGESVYIDARKGKYFLIDNDEVRISTGIHGSSLRVDTYRIKSG